jgi:hypothetical protein
MATFILTWNPDQPGPEQRRYEQFVDATADEATLLENWSVWGPPWRRSPGRPRVLAATASRPRHRRVRPPHLRCLPGAALGWFGAPGQLCRRGVGHLACAG